MSEDKSKLDLFKEVVFQQGDVELIYMRAQHAWNLDDLPDVSFMLVDKETGDEELFHYGLVYKPLTYRRESFSGLRQPYPPLVSRAIARYFMNMLTEFGLILKDATELRFIDAPKFVNEAFERVMRQKYNPIANAVARPLGTVFVIPVNGCGVIKIYPRPETSDSMFENFTSRNDQYDILRGSATFYDTHYSWGFSNPHAQGFGTSSMPSLMQEIQEVVFAAFPWLACGLMEFHSIVAVHPAQINFHGNGHNRIPGSVEDHRG